MCLKSDSESLSDTGSCALFNENAETYEFSYLYRAVIILKMQFRLA